MMPDNIRTRITIVLPAYNEQANIGRLLDRIDASMTEDGLSYRVIVVDDGSTDRTVELLDKRREAIPIRILRHDVNQGLGASIRDGLFLAGEGLKDDDIVITMDADETHTPGLILRMVRMIREGHDVVIASRYQPGARVRGVPPGRRLLSFAASVLFRVSFPGYGVRDFTCGYRAYRGSALKQAISTYGDRFLTSDGFQCMVDILLKLMRLDLVFGEVPLILRYDLKASHSKMRVTRTALQTIALLVRRRLGNY